MVDLLDYVLNWHYSLRIWYVGKYFRFGKNYRNCRGVKWFIQNGFCFILTDYKNSV